MLFVMRYRNPTQFYLTPGQAHDLQGADALLSGVKADFFLAERKQSFLVVR